MFPKHGLGSFCRVKKDLGSGGSTGGNEKATKREQPGDNRLQGFPFVTRTPRAHAPQGDNMKHVSTIFSGLMALGLAGVAFGQEGSVAKDTIVKLEDFETLKGQVESLNEGFLVTKTTVDKLAKIKVSGYIQAQWQHADSAGVASVAGGNFPARVLTGANTAPGTDQRFQLRRGRLKTTYETATSRYVLQIDVVPTGVAIKDAYATLMEPWLKTFSATAGVFDRPFGHEISYSSSTRESPERSRVFQTVFPGERDLGAKLEANPTERMGLLQYFNLKAGAFTGMGPTANENDKNLDFIGRAGFMAPIYALNLSIDGGVSVYRGNVTSANDTVLNLGAGTYVVSADTSAAHAFKFTNHERSVTGVDMQVYYTIPVIGDLVGGTALRGEYLWGRMPGVKSSSAPYTTNTAVVNREFEGWYVILVQNIGDKVQGVAKYDVYDPNTGVTGSQIGVGGSNLNAADLKYTTIGLGAIYHWDENIKLTAYYDKVENETVNPAATSNSLRPFTKDLKDNVFTARVQVKF
jgi:hypothetical protein